MMQDEKIGLPYAISVFNTTDNEVLNVSILDQDAKINNDGSGEYGGIIMSSSMPGVSYERILSYIKYNPIVFGQTHIQILRRADQEFSSKLNKEDKSDGMKSEEPLLFSNINELMYVCDKKYRVDFYTRITFDKILPQSHFHVLFYPAASIKITKR